jgi:hypothetical protein
MGTYRGEILKDLTSFAFAQQLLDKRGGEISFLIDLDSIIESLLFQEKILVIQPTYPDEFTPPLPPILEELRKRGFVDICSPTFSCREDDLAVFLKEIIQLVPPRKAVKIYREQREIQDLVRYYDAYFRVSTNPGIIKLMRKSGLRKKNLIPVYSLLVRTHIHMRYIHEIEEKQGKKVPYSPSIVRKLTETMIESYRTKALSIFMQILRKIELEKEIETEALDQFQTPLFKLRLPVLTGIILPECKEPWDILDVALNLRNDKKVKHFRNFLTVYQGAIYEDDKESIRKCERRLKETLLDLKEEYEGGTILRRIKIIPLLITLFGICTGNIASIISGLTSGIEPYLDSLTRYFIGRNLIFLYTLKERKQVLANLDKEIERVFGIQFPW